MYLFLINSFEVEAYFAAFVSSAVREEESVSYRYGTGTGTATATRVRLVCERGSGEVRSRQSSVVQRHHISRKSNSIE